MEEQAIALRELAGQIAVCPRCDLSKTRTHAVPGEGSPNADIVFIGEGPGFYEDQQARPFVGPAGKFLDELLASIGLRRENVYICNVIKCRPPNNRDPLPGEISACKPWLDRQLEIIKPRLIVTLGRFSMNRYFPGQSIGRIRGQAKRVDDVTVVPLYHPAAALHQASLRRTIEQDFLKLPAILAEALKKNDQPREPEPVQMQLL
ncbi:MAG: uracil-DNA glycosylase [Chloroflexi bacterium RBG_16_68_14]|nr:MAG: uracil-DNA glycosylase [Chloroflexi bacterium RBG_16_68_14]